MSGMFSIISDAYSGHPGLMLASMPGTQGQLAQCRVESEISRSGATRNTHRWTAANRSSVDKPHVEG